jgi:hypothetical protein
MCLAQTLVVQTGYYLAGQKQGALVKTGKPRKKAL